MSPLDRDSDSTPAPGGPVRILLTDGEQRSTLAAVRSLGRAGRHVEICSGRRTPLAGASRFCRATHLVADPASDPDGFRSDVERIVDERGVRLVLPMTDVSAPLVLGLRQSRPAVVVPFPELSAYDEISDKARLMEVAAELGVPVPRQVVLRCQEGVAGSMASASLTFPVVLKPARSAVRSEGRVRKFGVTLVSREEDLAPALSRYDAAAYPILVQERIVGPGLGVFALADRGRTIAAFGHRRLREKPPTGGVSVYRESVPVREDVGTHAERILRHFAWTGVAMVEFKEDAVTGTPYLMEVNGRFWGSLQLAIDAGVDFPEMLVRLALGESVAPVADYRLDVRSRWLWGDVDHLLWMFRAPRDYRRTYPALPSRATALGRFLVPWRPGDHFEVLRASDPRPFLRETVQWFGALKRKAARRPGQEASGAAE